MNKNHQEHINNPKTHKFNKEHQQQHHHHEQHHQEHHKFNP
jgi:hypothetical protein